MKNLIISTGIGILIGSMLVGKLSELLMLVTSSGIFIAGLVVATLLYTLYEILVNKNLKAIKDKVYSYNRDYVVREQYVFQNEDFKDAFRKVYSQYDTFNLTDRKNNSLLYHSEDVTNNLNKLYEALDSLSSSYYSCVENLNPKDTLKFLNAFGKEEITNQIFNLACDLEKLNYLLREEVVVPSDIISKALKDSPKDSSEFIKNMKEVVDKSYNLEATHRFYDSEEAKKLFGKDNRAFKFNFAYYSHRLLSYFK